MTHPASSVQRLLKQWGDEAVIFDQASGDTHYLKPFTLAVYQACCEHPGYNEEELAGVLATRIGVSITPDLHEWTQTTLDSLHTIGLLESA